ncbi:hypothetical protein EW146_g5615 [Bondarzewia mesenterica]|uniref:ENTH domain-containing protein n=1 Tax=Bondarzewia mesenterica TaxID=1095465 RepID=A0A4S4LSU0_9AGAM|nr:hypothetical protein EW146_g5615 [Bondarzewia mesenterica]
MSSFDKVVKNACKPKPNPPKSKYLDPIIAATWSDDGAVHDVCKALSPRFREPNAIVCLAISLRLMSGHAVLNGWAVFGHILQVVFKALIVLHTMIRNGATDKVLAYLSSSDVLRLKNVSGGQWEGYSPPENLQNYANYLNARIRAYRDLKHDAIHVQSESNRDARLSMSLEEDARNRAKSEPSASKGPVRSKTIMGRKLRVMTVEKGLLRETKVVQKMIDALVDCRFYLDNLEDELTVTSLRMLVKDLLILFQAGNEGVINVLGTSYPPSFYASTDHLMIFLEHYFEMSHVDAEQALAIYRHFCKQTEQVVEYLGVAKKLQNILHVPIPNLKHAPVSLVGALEEYLNDPNFEQNRIEYKTNKDAAERNLKNGKAATSPATNSESAKPTESSSAGSSSTEPPKAESSQAMSDFFSAIQEEQQSMFNPQTGSPTGIYFQQQAAHNPFVQRQMTTGFPSQPFAQSPMQAQPTGFIQSQFTAMPSFQQSQQSPFLQTQPTGFLQPQATGVNPFRQSVLMPQMTSTSPFTQPGLAQAQLHPTGSTNPFPTHHPTQSSPAASFPSAPVTQQSFSTALPSFNTSQPHPSFASSSPFAASMASNNPVPARPASTPITSMNFSNKPASPPPQPIKTHQTGSRNPFGMPVQPPPPVPKPPTLMELAMGANSNFTQQPQSQPQQPQQTGVNGLSAFSALAGSSSAPQQGSNMANVASSFSMNGSGSPKTEDNKSSIPWLPNFNPSAVPGQTTSTTSSTFSDSVFTSLSTQPTGATSNNASVSPSITFTAPLKPQTTGFSGIKAFKPSSSFGASLLESLPPIPQSSPGTPTGQPSPTLNTNSTTSPGVTFRSQPTGMQYLGSQPTGATGGLTPFGSNAGTGSTVGVGLRPQLTGAGAANPFRATMIGSGTGMGAGPLGSGLTGSSSSPTFGGGMIGSGMGASLFAQNTGVPTGTGMGASLFGASTGQGAGASFGSGNAARTFGSGFGLGAGQDPSKQQQNGMSSLI